MRLFEIPVENAVQETLWHVVEVNGYMALDVMHFLDLHLRRSHNVLRDKESDKFCISHWKSILLHPHDAFDFLHVSQKLLDKLL